MEMEGGEPEDRNKSQTRQHLQPNVTHQFHIPAPLVAKIVSYVGENGIEGLKSWIKSGKEGKEAVFSDETLSRVRIDKSPHYAWWSDSLSWYNHFFKKCLQHGNPYALYIDCLRLGFAEGDLPGALQKLSNIKYIHPVATLAYLILSDCGGIDRFDVYLPFKRKYWRKLDIFNLGEELKDNIIAIEPRRRNTYKQTWHCEDFPECYDYHYYNRHRNNERCQQCVYFYLSLEVCELS